MPTKYPRKQDAVSLFEARAQSARSPQDLHDYLAFLPRLPKYVSFRTRPVYSPRPIDKVAERWLSRDSNLRRFNDDARAFELTARSAHRKRTPETRPSPAGVFAFLAATQPGLARVTTISRSDFWNRAIRRFLRRVYPYVSSIILDQKEMRDILLRLEAHLLPDRHLTITELGLREPRPGLPAKKRLTRFDADRRWTEASLRDILVQVHDRGQWFTSIGFSVTRYDQKHDEYVLLARGRVYRNGETHLDGLFPDLSDAILQWIEEAAERRISLLSNRGLRERGYSPAKPIALEFGEGVFAEPQELKRFASVVASFPNSTKAVFHANPYYHATVADAKDGSSIDVWVLNPARALLVPQAKSSAPAYGRFISHIFTFFREGTVGEFDGPS